MIKEKELNCPICGGDFKRYGKVKRLVRRGYGEKYWISIQRKRCKQCGFTHRVLPETLYPYKHYERRIIDGFISEQISIFDVEYEDYPVESTINNWLKSNPVLFNK